MGFGKDGRGVILYSNEENTIAGALGTAGVALLDCDFSSGNLEEDFRLLRIKGAVCVEGLANGEVVLIGLSDGELTLTEVGECLNATPVDRNDHATTERAQRPVFPIGTIQGVTAGNAPMMLEFDEKIRWTFPAPEGFTLWVFNPSDAAAHAGALTCTHWAKAFGVWVT